MSEPTVLPWWQEAGCIALLVVAAMALVVAALTDHRYHWSETSADEQVFRAEKE